MRSTQDNDDGSAYASSDAGSSFFPSISNFNEREPIFVDNQRQSRRMRLVYRLILVTLIALAVAGPITVYRAQHQIQLQAFEHEFHELASAIQDSFGLKMAAALSAADGMSVYATSYVDNNNLTWPFVTLPHFDFQALNTVTLAQMVSVTFIPIITNTTRQAWEVYTADNTDWIHTAIARQKELSNTTDHRYLQEDEKNGTELIPPDKKNGVTVNIYAITKKVRHVDTSPGPYAVPWQFTPLTSRGINYNLRSLELYSSAMDTTIASGRPTITTAISFVGENLQLQADFYSIRLQQYFGDPNVTYKGEPTSRLIYPIFDSFNKSNQKVVAFVATGIFWPFFFESILPENSAPVHCVMKNPCGQEFTIAVEGRHGIHLGGGGAHDSSQDHLVVQASVADIVQKANFDFSNTLSPFDDDWCPYSLHVYPTQDLYHRHVTKAPIVLATLSSCFFVVFFMVLLSYSLVVKARLHRIGQAATESGGIVSSLYPKEVLERLLERMRAEKNLSNGKKNSDLSRAKSKLRELAGVESTSPQKTINENHNMIADLHSNCTVFFAYIAGFSEWSQIRTPEDTFLLLETIFIALDKLTHRHNVFKIESVADSYLAATGLPRAQPDHAVRICRFARQSIDLVRKLLIGDLTHLLGPDTSDMNLKIGVHSGQILAGIMDGDKPRLCVFGDTINSASRISSNGAAGCIHVSSTTASILKDSGKERWLTQRQGMVEMKGKGKMLTYWLGKGPSVERIDMKNCGKQHLKTPLSVKQEESSACGSNGSMHHAEDLFALQFSKMAHERGVESNDLSKEFGRVATEILFYHADEDRVVHPIMSAMKLLTFIREDAQAEDTSLERGLSHLAVVIAVACGIEDKGGGKEENAACSRAERFLCALESDSSLSALREFMFGQSVEQISLFRDFVLRVANVGSEDTNHLSLIVRASLISHYMQHWNVFERLVSPLDEVVRTFDEQAIPLARAMRDCGAFSASVEECVTFAMDNRRRWAAGSRE